MSRDCSLPTSCRQRCFCRSRPERPSVPSVRSHPQGPDLLSLPGVASVIPMVLRIAVGFLLFPKHLVRWKPNHLLPVSTFEPPPLAAIGPAAVQHVSARATHACLPLAAKKNPPPHFAAGSTQAIKIARTDTHMIDEDLRAHKKELRKLKKKMEEEERKANKQAAKQQKKEAARGGGGAGDGAPKKPEDDEPMFAVDEKNHYNEFRLSRWPTGVLLINVMQAKDLPIADIGVGVSIDPYFKIVRALRCRCCCFPPAVASFASFSTKAERARFACTSRDRPC